MVVIRIFNLPRGGGKSMRMLFASEFNKAPILCANHRTKDYLLNLAKRFGIAIPEPIVVGELNQKYLGKSNPENILVDEPLRVLQELLNSYGRGCNIIGCALSDEENQSSVRHYGNSGYIDN